MAPIAFAAAGIAILHRRGLASAKVVSIVTFAALGAAILNGLLLVFRLAKK